MLGLDWMKGVSPISFNFNRMEVSFEREGRKTKLIGGKEMGACKMILGKRLQKVIREKWSQLANLFSIVALEDSHAEPRGRGEVFLTVSAP